MSRSSAHTFSKSGHAVADEVNTKSGGDDDVESQPLPLSVGSVLDGRFHIERMLGAGGMGYVVLARHVALEERVAIKLLLPGRADEDARHRLVREARAAVKIKSDHVVRILDVVNTGPNAPYIVMEHLEGEDLAARLDRAGPLDPAAAAEVIVQACEVVGEAHYRGLAHRDIKPSNIFLVAKPGQPRFVKVLDFGISKVLDGGTERLTASNSLLGSPAYAAPEQLRDSRAVDRRCDVWALGVVLYESIVGQLPFSGPTIAEVCMKILEQPPTPPPAQSAVPERLLAIIDRCLQKEPGQRYDNLAELAIALREFAPRAADESIVYLSALGPALPELPKESSRASATADTVLTAQGQTFDTKEVTKRRPVALAIIGFSAAAGAATFFSAKAMLPSSTVRSESPPAVVAASAPVESASGASSSAPIVSASSTASAAGAPSAPNVEPIANPEPVASAVEPRSPVLPQRVLPKPLKPKKPAEKESKPGAPWVDSR
jgi:serine/threonine-protein kinase